MSTTRKPSTEPRRIGRPPAGARAGEKVKDYPQLSIRLPAEVKAKLHALSLVSGRPQWRLVSDAIEAYVRSQPRSAQQKVGAVLARKHGRTARVRR